MLLLILMLYISLLLLQILAAIENYQYSKMRFLHMNYPASSCKHSIRIIGLSSIHLKRSCQVAIFLKKYQGIHACLVSDFHPRLWKCWLYGKFGIFISGWNFTSGLPNWAEISTRYMELKFLQVIAIYIYFKEEFII